MNKDVWENPKANVSKKYLISYLGRDATRAFVTGDFTEAGLVEDIVGLSFPDLIGLQDWIQFYEKEYSAIGTYDTFQLPVTTCVTR